MGAKALDSHATGKKHITIAKSLGFTPAESPRNVKEEEKSGFSYCKIQSKRPPFVRTVNLHLS